MIRNAVQRIKFPEYQLMKAWFGDATHKEIVIVYDIFTNKDLGPNSSVPVVIDENRILVVTTKSSMATALGATLAIRASVPESSAT